MSCALNYLLVGLKSGYEFEDSMAFEKYLGLDGDAIEYSQEGEPHSPLEISLRN